MLQYSIYHTHKHTDKHTHTHTRAHRAVDARSLPQFPAGFVSSPPRWLTELPSAPQVGVAFSPCLRYVAAGGEDRTATLFDLRMGSVLHRLRDGHTDVVRTSPVSMPLPDAMSDSHG